MKNQFVQFAELKLASRVWKWVSLDERNIIWFSMRKPKVVSGKLKISGRKMRIGTFGGDDLPIEDCIVKVTLAE